MPKKRNPNPTLAINEIRSKNSTTTHRLFVRIPTSMARKAHMKPGDMVTIDMTGKGKAKKIVVKRLTKKEQATIQGHKLVFANPLKTRLAASISTRKIFNGGTQEIHAAESVKATVNGSQIVLDAPRWAA